MFLAKCNAVVHLMDIHKVRQNRKYFVLMFDRLSGGSCHVLAVMLIFANRYKNIFEGSTKV